MTLRQRIRFYQQIAVLVRAGLPIRSSVDRLRERMRARELDILSQQINAGERLGEAFAAAHFLPFECHLIVAGERSGHLETIFDHMAQFWQREQEFRQAIIAPLIYPLVILNLAVVLGAGVELLSTSWPVALFHLIVCLVLLYGVGTCLFLFVRFTWSSPEFKRMWLLTPIVGRALRTAFAYRWITALRLEFGAGISLYRAVGDAWRASGFVDCERIALEAEESVRAGESLSSLVTKWRQLPRDWSDFMATGEVSGGFEQAFTNLEAEAAHDWKIAQQNMANWLPKIAYFIVLIIAALQVGSIFYHVIVDPINQVERELNQ